MKSPTDRIRADKGRREVSPSKQRIFHECAAQSRGDRAGFWPRVYARGGRLYTMGNGGSSCAPATLPWNFSIRSQREYWLRQLQYLAHDCAMLTAVGNDLGFQHVFLRQVIALMRRDDALIGVSTSGYFRKSAAGLQRSKAGWEADHHRRRRRRWRQDARPRGLSRPLPGGFERQSIHRVQETHVAIYHILWDLTHTLLADNRGLAGEGNI